MYHNGIARVSQWYYNGITVVLQWYHSGIPKVDCGVSPDIVSSKLHVVELSVKWYPVCFPLLSPRHAIVILYLC
jgi:hypothetical protein